MIDFDRAHEIIQAQQKRGLGKKKLANNTYLSQDEKSFKIELHNNAIIRILNDGSYEIDTRDSSGKSWQTLTTKARINEFAPIQIHQKRGAWYLQDGSKDDCDHIWSHLEECYFVPSLLFWAIKEQLYSQPELIFVLVQKDCERGNDASLKRHLRKFFSKRQDLLLNFVQS